VTSYSPSHRLLAFISKCIHCFESSSNSISNIPSRRSFVFVLTMQLFVSFVDASCICALRACVGFDFVETSALVPLSIAWLSALFRKWRPLSLDWRHRRWSSMQNVLYSGEALPSSTTALDDAIVSFPALDRMVFQTEFRSNRVLVDVRSQLSRRTNDRSKKVA